MGGCSNAKMHSTLSSTLAALISLNLVLYGHAGEDDQQYEYDPFDSVPGLPDQEGSLETPTNIWHACRFGSKKGGIYDLRPLSKNVKLLKAHYRWGSDMDITTEDWVHQDVTQYNVTYYLNVCADVIELPPACRRLSKLTPAPAFQVTSNGQCHALGTLKTFKWKPINSDEPDKGMSLSYKNGDPCGNQGQTRSVKYLFTCSKFYGKDSGPMVVYQKDECHHDVVWPSQFGCPSESVGQSLGLQDDLGQTSTTGKWLFALVVVLCVCGCAVYFLSKRSGAVGGYSSL